MSDPRWTVDDEGWFKYGSDRVLLALCLLDGDEVVDPGSVARDELKAAVRSAAEVPALREQVAELTKRRDEVVELSADKIKHVTQRLEATQTVIRRLLDGWTPEAEPVGEQTFNSWYRLSQYEPADDTWSATSEPLSDAEAQAIARARGDQT